VNDSPQVVVVGNPVDGIAIFGPFPTLEAAQEYADSLGHHEWWITELEPVDE
jgi:hypothetical protein